MFAITRNAIGRLNEASARWHASTRMAIVALPLAMIACGGDRQTATRSSGESAPATPVVPATRVTTSEKRGAIVGNGTGTETYDTGDAAYKAGNYRDAATMYKAHVDATPGDANGFYMLGLSRWKSGDFSDAKDAFDKSIDLNPGFAKSYFNEARLLLDMKRPTEALELIEKGRAIDSTSPDGVRLKARAQSESGDIGGAMSTYRALLVRDDADTWGLNNLGVLLLDRGQSADALGPLARAVQVKPTAPVFQNNYGMALERSGDRVAALHHYQEAVRSDSTFTKAVKNEERLRVIVTDTAATDEVSVSDLAEAFRQKVKSWKDTTVKSEMKPAKLP